MEVSLDVKPLRRRNILIQMLEIVKYNEHANDGGRLFELTDECDLCKAVNTCGSYAHQYDSFNVFYYVNPTKGLGRWACIGYDRPGNGPMRLSEEYSNVRESFQYGKPKVLREIGGGMYGEQQR